MIVYKNTNLLVEYFSVLSLLKSLNNLYPNFKDWFLFKAIPDIVAHNQKLNIAKHKDTVIGCALGKKTKEENKLRCVRVLPDYINKGVGLNLIDKMLKEINDDKPHCTVAEEMINTYSRIFINHYKFNINKVEKGLYRKNKLEYIFN